MAFPFVPGPSFRRPSVPGRRPPLFYGWYIVGASTINAALLLGMVFYGFGVFITPLTDDLGWATAAVAFGFTLQRMQAGLIGPLAGYAIDRLGSRPVALVWVALTGLGFLVFAGVQELWQFYAASILIAIGQTMGTIAPFSAALMHWFYRYRARATAFMMAGTGLGAVSIYPLVAVVEAVGWRTTLVLVAALVWVVGALTALVLRRPLQRYGLLPDGVAVVQTSSPGSPPVAAALTRSARGFVARENSLHRRAGLLSPPLMCRPRCVRRHLTPPADREHVDRLLHRHVPRPQCSTSDVATNPQRIGGKFTAHE